MNSKDNIDFERLLQDEELLKLISNQEISVRELSKLFAANPSFSREDLLFAVEFIRFQRSEKKEMTHTEISELWEEIMDRHHNSNGDKGASRTAGRYFWRKAAASAALLFLCSIMLFTFLTPDDSLKNFAESMPENSGENARIILSDGSEYILDNNHARVEYGADGKEVIIKKSDSDSEKLSNQHAEDEVILNQAIVPYGRRHRIDLSDGTVVELNSGSRLVFPAVFSGKKREVYLQGEAFFTVSRKEEQPFVVRSDFMDVQVLGTQFNVCAYKGENMVSAVLAEGSVDVVHKGKLISNTRVNLQPGQGYFYSVEKSEYEIAEVNLNQYISWKDGWLYMKDQPVQDIVKRLEKYYNIKIDIEEPRLAGAMVSGKLVLSDQMDHALGYLAKALEVRSVEQADGTFVFAE